MFKLTTKEQQIVALLLGAIVLGTVVKQWRERTQEATPAVAVQTR